MHYWYLVCCFFSLVTVFRFFPKEIYTEVQIPLSIVDVYIANKRSKIESVPCSRSVCMCARPLSNRSEWRNTLEERHESTQALAAVNVWQFVAGCRFRVSVYNYIQKTANQITLITKYNEICLAQWKQQPGEQRKPSTRRKRQAYVKTSQWIWSMLIYADQMHSQWII